MGLSYARLSVVLFCFLSKLGICMHSFISISENVIEDY